jgi:hypothetical protein
LSQKKKRLRKIKEIHESDYLLAQKDREVVIRERKELLIQTIQRNEKYS